MIARLMLWDSIGASRYPSGRFLLAPASPLGLSFPLCISAGPEPGGKCGVGQVVTTRPARPRCGHVPPAGLTQPRRAGCYCCPGRHPGLPLRSLCIGRPRCESRQCREHWRPALPSSADASCPRCEVGPRAYHLLYKPVNAERFHAALVDACVLRPRPRCNSRYIRTCCATAAAMP
jgi:hypothetical protein